jgi:signal transduction histidine kinase
MTALTPVPRSSITPHRRGSWAGAGLLGAVRGLALVCLAGVAFLVPALLIAALAAELGTAILIFPLLLIPPTLGAVRRLANLARRLSGEWCGVPIPPPYGASDEPVQGFWQRIRRGFRMLGDPATWRDVLWMFVDPMAPVALPLIPGIVVLWGLFGALMPAYWNLVFNWYAFIHVTSAGTALLSVPLGIVFIALGAWLARPLLRWYGKAAHSMLAPTRRAELRQQVAHLAETRAEAVDTGAAEIRRIERDLHDGAQARLVAMGMTLSAAEEVLDRNPDAARALLLEARDASVKALSELRDLVRGIHPPVLADRGIAEAVRALAMDSPMRVQVTNELPGRPPAPVESAAYFAVSELLANVSKHAGARQAWIDMRYERGMLRIDVGDDGQGGADPGRGTGLRGIERRLSAFDGILALSSPPGGPTVATMELPCELSSPKTSSF